MKTEKYKLDFETFAKHHTIEEIAKHYKITENNARIRCWQWHCEFKKEKKGVPDYIIQQMRQYGKHHTLPEICLKFNLKYSNAYQRCKRYNIKYLNKPKDHYEKLERIVKSKGYTIPQYISKYGTQQLKQLTA